MENRKVKYGIAIAIVTILFAGYIYGHRIGFKRGYVTGFEFSDAAGVCVDEGVKVYANEMPAVNKPGYIPYDFGLRILEPFIFPGIILEDKPPPADADHDGIRDRKDNCVFDPNNDQADDDQDDTGNVCDGCTDSDEDGFGKSEFDISVCPGSSTLPDCDDANPEFFPEQAWYADCDGDTFFKEIPLISCAIPTGSATGCADAQTPDGGWSHTAGAVPDCSDEDPATTTCPGPPPTVCSIKVDTITEGSNSYQYASWLPDKDKTYAVTFKVFLEGSEVTPTPSITFDLQKASISTEAGYYTNDLCSYSEDPCYDVSPDYVIDPGDNGLSLTSKDYGGLASIAATTSVDVGGGTIEDCLTTFNFPKDSDDDGLADPWEEQYGTLGQFNGRDGDNDQDGLSNFEEYRGVIWGADLVYVAASPTGLYKTDAYIPADVGDHFRTNPTRRDLFIQYYGFEPYTETDDLTAPFALGEAFMDMGDQSLDVHVVDGSNPQSGLDTPVALNLDSVFISLNTTDVYLYDNVYLHTRWYPPTGVPGGDEDMRSWNIPVFGFSNIGNATAYGSATRLYKRAILNYFDDKPYHEDINAPTISLNKLDRLDCPGGDPGCGAVNDRDDDSIQDTGESPITEYDLRTEVMDYDNEIGYDHELSAMDIDSDMRVELPRDYLPANLDENSIDSDEYTFKQVIKHVVTHEIGHAIGLSGAHHEYPDLNCNVSIDWKRDDWIHQDAWDEIRIHNQ